MKEYLFHHYSSIACLTLSKTSYEYLENALNEVKHDANSYALCAFLDLYQAGWCWELEEKLNQENYVTIYLPNKVISGVCSELTTERIVNTLAQQYLNTLYQEYKKHHSSSEEKINTKEEFYNYQSKDGKNEVPFNNVTDQCIQQLAPSMTPQNPQLNTQAPTATVPQPATQTPATSPQIANPDPHTDYHMVPGKSEPVNSFGFSERQMTGIADFKRNFSVINNDMFDNYVRTWNPQLTGRQGLTPDNIDAFLTWLEQLGKTGC